MKDVKKNAQRNLNPQKRMQQLEALGAHSFAVIGVLCHPVSHTLSQVERLWPNYGSSSNYKWQPNYVSYRINSGGSPFHTFPEFRKELEIFCKSTSSFFSQIELNFFCRRFTPLGRRIKLFFSFRDRVSARRLSIRRLSSSPTATVFILFLCNLLRFRI